MNIRAFKYLLPFGVYGAAWLAFHRQGLWVFLPIVYAFVCIPLAELFWPPDARNMNVAEEAIAKQDRLYDLFVYLIVPMQLLALFWFLSHITQNGLLWWEKVGMVSAMGLCCGTFGINVGHELGHRKPKYEQWMAKILLLTSLYTHFFIEHNKGHHKHVSTPLDPSSAPKGMHLYRFWLRSVSGSWLKAWQIAAAELKKLGYPALHYRNEMLQLQVLQLLWLLAIGGIWSIEALLCTCLLR